MAESILELFSTLSPEEKVEQYSKLCDIHEEGKRVLNQFVQLPIDTQQEMYERMQELMREQERNR